MKLTLSAQIEAVLFFETDAISVKKLAALLGKEKSEVEAALEELRVALEKRGVALTRVGDEVMLTTSEEMAPVIEKLSREALEGELSRASVETLSVILYRGGATKQEIDYIRGVNCAFILRALQIRGLIERKPYGEGGRSFIYTPTFDLYNHLGIGKKEELPEYQRLTEELAVLSEEGKTAEEKEKEGQKKND